MGRSHTKPNEYGGDVTSNSCDFNGCKTCDSLSAFQVYMNTAPCGKAFPPFAAYQVLEISAGEVVDDCKAPAVIWLQAVLSANGWLDSGLASPCHRLSYYIGLLHD
ncbi:hypothetical protein CDAR_180991 [Caerostris darwini]|uniref:Uncharacterized protein n=1 Tax=Caerostris darwini TaxID=1538125 RepID=A0AAV4TXS4_9ARAC|nr:hypothetical protein CDAR_180991 [Caerostris darwini]